MSWSDLRIAGPIIRHPGIFLIGSICSLPILCRPGFEGEMIPRRVGELRATHFPQRRYALLISRLALNATGGKHKSGADYTHQRSLHLILIHFPTTAGSARFCLLCCQPEPISGTLAARKSPLTQRVPCRLPVWSRMNHLHEVQDIASSPTLHRQVLAAQTEVRQI